MKLKIKNSLAYIITCAFSVIMLLLMLIPYLVLVRRNYDETTNIFARINGYGCTDLFQTGFGGIMVSLFQILFIFILILLLVISILGILRGFDIIKFEIKSKKFDLNDFNKLMLFCILILSALVFVFSLICAVSNKTDYLWIALSVGSIINLLVSLGVFLLYCSLENKGVIISSKIIDSIFRFKKNSELKEETINNKKTDNEENEIVVEIEENN